MNAISIIDIMDRQETGLNIEEVEDAGESEETEATNVEATEKAEALAYLHKRFPEVNDIELVELLEQNTTSISNILEARLAYEACSNCDGTSCRLPERLWRGYHVVNLEERIPNRYTLRMMPGWTICIRLLITGI